MRIVELIGPPGVGKTTLGKICMIRNNNLQIYRAPYFRNVKHIPFFIKNLISLVPTLIQMRHQTNAGWLTKRDIVLMTILRGWDHVLVRKIPENNQTVRLLDEGAIGFLARLHGFGSTLLKTQSAQDWREQTYRQWASSIDFVVQLNAPMPVLVERVRGRQDQYEMKEMSNSEVAEHLLRIQESLQHVLVTLQDNLKSPKILSFDTVEKSPEQICDEVFSEVFNRAK